MLLLRAKLAVHCITWHLFLRLASLGGGPQAHVHMKGMNCISRNSINVIGPPMPIYVWIVDK